MKRVAIIAAALALGGCAVQYVPQLQADGTIDYGVGSAGTPLYDQIVIAGMACSSLEDARAGGNASECIKLDKGTHVGGVGRTQDATFFRIRVGRWPVLKDYWVPASMLMVRAMRA